MVKRIIIWFAVTCCSLTAVTAFQPHNQRSYYIPASFDFYKLDSLSIIEESFEIYGPDNKELNPAFYQINFAEAAINLKIPEYWHNDSLLVKYKVFPLNLAKPYSHKDSSWVSLPGPGESFKPISSYREKSEFGLLDFPGLNSSGSITRGVTVGNKQDLTLNSAMNLQLSGNITDDIEVRAVISDQDIPIQPEGSTQQLQEFDKVFIELKGYNTKLIAGDFEAEKPESFFLNFSRKSQGAMLNYETPDDYESGIVKGFDLSLSGAVAKGIFASNEFQGIEGNQGPYRLSGNNSESYIIVLSGTEKVYIDGDLLTRGMENDYVINYNQAEITFTANTIITSNSRIKIEFEYAARDYVRSMYFASAGIDTDHGNININFFSEQDHPGQPLFKEITEEQKNIMAAVGDSIHKAFTWNFDSIGFKNDRVMYLLTDSLGFDTVFVHSTDPDRAHYQVGFTYMGEGKGNYKQVNSAANGKVFQWIEPVNNEPRGTHEPIQLLSTPQKKQMLTIAYDFNINKNTNAGFEWALSNNDINLFSDLDKKNNAGMAVFAFVKNKTRVGKNSNDEEWILSSEVTHETADKHFYPVERYRSVEFERDWNLADITQTSEEHSSGISFSLSNKDNGYAKYELGTFFKGKFFSAYKNSLDVNLRTKKNRIFYKGSYLSSEGLQNTGFYRHKGGYTRVFRYLNAGFIQQIENNKVNDTENNQLKLQSFAFDESELFITNNDTAKNIFRLFYKYRRDYFPEANKFDLSSVADEYGAAYEYRANTNQKITAKAVYRNVKYINKNEVSLEDDNNVSGRLDYFSKWLQGAVTSTMFYEAASGVERKHEYIYVEVPAGQGIYTWVDYNGNGIMELDEFETAQYPDQANFIKVFVPTEEFIKALSNTYSHTLNIDPLKVWRDESGFKKLLSRFSNQTSYSVNKKILDKNTLNAFNPFHIDLNDTLISTLATSFRNTFYFNRISPLFSLELTYRDDRNKNLLSNGFESRHNESLRLSSRWNITRKYAVNLIIEKNKNTSSSEFFMNRNFNIISYGTEPGFNILFSRKFRISLFYGYMQKQNHYSEEKELAGINKAGIESRLNFPGKTSLSLRFQVSDIYFPHDENTPVAFDMLESLRPGTNLLWSISWQQNLNEYLLLILNYHARKTPDNSTIHTGNVQVKAFF